MNRIFKVIFNKTTQRFVVVSELGKNKSHNKTSNKTTSSHISSVMQLFALSLVAFNVQSALANGVAAGGNALGSLGNGNVEFTIGGTAHAYGDGSVAIGQNAKTGNGQQSLGYANYGPSTVTKNDPYTINQQLLNSNLHLGMNPFLDMPMNSNTNNGWHGIAIGNEAHAGNRWDISLGSMAQTPFHLGNMNPTSYVFQHWTVGNLGQNLKQETTYVVDYGNRTAIGHEATANGTRGIALGTMAQTGLAGNVNGVVPSGLNGPAGYTYSYVYGVDSIAIGSYALSTGHLSSIALGTGSFANKTASFGMALGAGTRVDPIGGVALGSFSTADRAALPVNNGNVQGMAQVSKIQVTDRSSIDPTQGQVFGVGSQSNLDAIAKTAQYTRGAVSVGGKGEAHTTEQMTDANFRWYGSPTGKTEIFTRQITNVAAGSKDSDAVNVAQLRGIFNILPTYVHVNDGKHPSDQPSGNSTTNYGIGNATAGAKNAYDVAIGVNAITGDKTTHNEGAISIGHNVQALGNKSIAIGQYAHSKGANAISMGAFTNGTYGAQSNNSIAIGGGNTSAGTGQITGYDQNAKEGGNFENAIAIGQHTLASHKNSIAMGTGTASYANDSLAIGSQANVYSNSAIGAIAIGHKAHVESLTTTAGRQYPYPGFGTSQSSIAIGDDVQVMGAPNAIVIGSKASQAFTTKDAIAIGTHALAGSNSSGSEKLDGPIALGSHAVATGLIGKSGYDPVTKTSSTNTSAVWQPTLGELSLGSPAQAEVHGTRPELGPDGRQQNVSYTIPAHPEYTRRIKHLAAGVDDTDAVNVAQLKQIISLNNGSWNIGQGESDTKVGTVASKHQVNFIGKDGTTVEVKRSSKGNGNFDVVISSAKNTIHTQYQGDNKTIVTRTADQVLSLTGGAIDAVNNSIKTTSNTDGSIHFEVAKTLNDMTKITFGKSQQDGDNSPPVSIGSDGINAGGKQITNVKSGGNTETNGANIGDVKKAIKPIQDKVAGNTENITQNKGDIAKNKASTEKNAGDISTNKGNITQNKEVLDKIGTVKVAGNGGLEINGNTELKKGNVTITLNSETVAKNLVTTPEAKKELQNGLGDGTNTAGNKGLVNGNTLHTSITNVNNEVTDKGLNFAGDNYNAQNEQTKVHKNLGQMLEFVGGAKGNLTDNNIGVNVKNGKIHIQLAKNLTGLDSVKAGNTTIGKDGITVNGDQGQKPITINKNGIDAGDHKITNVGAPTSGSDAANKTYVDQTIDSKEFGLSDSNGNKLSQKLGTTIAVKGAKDSDIVTKVTTEAGNSKALTIDLTQKVKNAIAEGQKHTQLTNGDTTTATQITADGENKGKWKVEVNKATISVNNDTGAITQSTDANKFVDAQSLTTALGHMGFKAKVENATTTNDEGQMIHSGDVMIFKAGDNMNVTRNGSTFTFATSKTPTFDKVTVGGKTDINPADKPVVISDKGINAGDKQITNVKSGGDTGTNGANINDVNRIVNPVKTQAESNKQTISSLQNNTIQLGADGNTSTDKQALSKEGGLKFNIVGENGVTTTASGDQVKVSLDKNVVRDVAQKSVKVIAGQHTTVTTGTEGDIKTYAVNVTADGKVENGNKGIVTGGTVKTALDNQEIGYSANKTAAQTNPQQTVKLSQGLNFTNGTNTTATVAKDGVVTYDIKSALTGIHSVAGNGAKISLGNGGVTLSNGKPNGSVQLHGIATGTAPTDAVNVKQLGETIKANATVLKDGHSTTVTGTGTKDNPYRVNVVTGEIKVNDKGIVTGDVSPKEAKTLEDNITKAQKALDDVKKAKPADKDAIAKAEKVLADAEKAADKAGLNKVATVQNVADAINKSGFTLQGDGANGSLVKPGSTVNLQGKTVKVNGKEQRNITVTNNNGTVTFDLSKNLTLGTINNGKVTNDGSVGGLKDHFSETNKTSGEMPNFKDPAVSHQAATVSDVLNAGWNLQGNGKAVDFVKPYDTVNFVNGAGTTVVTSSNGATSTIQINSLVRYVDDKGQPLVEHDGKYYPDGSVVGKDGKVYPKDTPMKDGVPTDKNTQPLNPVTPAKATIASPSGSHEPVKLGNIAEGKGPHDAVNVKQLNETIKANATVLKDGHSTTVTGAGTQDNPYRVNVVTGDVTIDNATGKAEVVPQAEVKALTDKLSNAANDVKAKQAALANAEKALATATEQDKTAKETAVKAAKDALAKAQDALDNAQQAYHEKGLDKIATTQGVANAINKSGFGLSSDSGSTVVHPGDKVQLTGKNGNITVSQTTDKNGNTTVHFDLNKHLDLSTTAKGKDGKTTTTYGSIDGLKNHFLPNDQTGSAPATSGSLPTGFNPTKDSHQAATVGDVLHAGWNLQGNGKAVDFVKPYDTVNFVNGVGTTVVTNSNGTTSIIKINSLTRYVDDKGQPLVEHNGKYYPAGSVIHTDGQVYENGKPAHTVEPSKIGLVSPNNKPIKLGNIANGTSDHDAVNVGQLKEVKALASKHSIVENKDGSIDVIPTTKDGQTTYNIKVHFGKISKNNTDKAVTGAEVQKALDKKLNVNGDNVADKATFGKNVGIDNMKGANGDSSKLVQAKAVKQYVDNQINEHDDVIHNDMTKALANQTITYKANGKEPDDVKPVKLSEGLDFTNGNNTTAEVAPNGVVKVNVNQKLDHMEKATFDHGDGNGSTTVDRHGIDTHGNAGSTQITGGKIVIKGPVGADGKTPTVVIQNGGISVDNVDGNNPKSAVNVGYLHEKLRGIGLGMNNVNHRINQLNNKVEHYNKDLRAGIAGATAIGFLQQPNQGGASRVSAAIGGYKNQQAVAIGYARTSDNNKLTFKVGASVNTRSDVNYGASFGYQW